MPTTIACPSCSRALNLPGDASNRVVQCPACRHQFHPAEAEAPATRPTAPKVDFTPPKPDAARPLPRSSGRPGGPPPPPMDEAPRRSRRKREEYDVCPKCNSRVPRDASRCPDCDVEFEPATDDDYRPWERPGEERRDSEPHRGTFILLLGLGSLLTWFMVCPFWGLGIVSTVAGAVMGASAWAMARTDLRRMDERSMANEGRGSTHGGMICGIIGLVLNILGAIVATYWTVDNYT